MMKDSILYTLLLAAPLATAQTYSGFEINISNELEVIYGDTTLKNGEQLPRAGM
jgi:hypothetical protein